MSEPSSPLRTLLSILTVPLSYKLKVNACEKGTPKEQKLRNVTVNYLFVVLISAFYID
jgi:hypothetical protein